MSHAFSVILQHFIFVFASSTITPFQEDPELAVVHVQMTFLDPGASLGKLFSGRFSKKVLAYCDEGWE